jgi:hypothetical protein
VPDPGVDGRTLALGGVTIFVQGVVASMTAATYVAPPIAYFVFGVAGLVLAAEQTRLRATDLALNVRHQWSTEPDTTPSEPG